MSEAVSTLNKQPSLPAAVHPMNAAAPVPHSGGPGTCPHWGTVKYTDLTPSSPNRQSGGQVKGRYTSVALLVFEQNRASRSAVNDAMNVMRAQGRLRVDPSTLRGYHGHVDLY